MKTRFENTSTAHFPPLALPFQNAESYDEKVAIHEFVMDEIIYVRLLEEGTIVYRPVKATRKSDNQYVLGEADCEWEVWEFLPNSLVSTEVIKLGPGWSQEPCVVATKIIEGESYIAEGIQNSEVVMVEKRKGDLTVTLRSCGYGRPRGSLFDINFQDVTDVAEHAVSERLLFGLCEIFCPAQPRKFRLEVGEEKPVTWLEVTARKIVIG